MKDRKPNLKLKFKLLAAFTTQSHAAFVLGIRDDRLSAIIRRRSKPTQELLELICKVLKCSPEELGL